MSALILLIYRFFARRRVWLVALIGGVLLLLAWGASKIRFQEDISAFLAQGEETTRIHNAYRTIGSNKLFINVMMSDSTVSPDETMIMEAITRLATQLEEADQHQEIKKITYRVDQQQLLDLVSFVTEQMPYFLSEADYRRLDTLVNSKQIEALLQENKQLLFSPMGSVMKQQLIRDPLHLASPLLELLSGFKFSDYYRLSNDFFFSRDGREGVLMLESNNPISETDRNALMVDMIHEVIGDVGRYYQDDLSITCFGPAVIAVTNARQIKKDSLRSMLISLILITALLIYAFREGRSIFLILLSLLFGWLFALGLLSFIREEVSIIAIGISSIMIGIAINYPLHFLEHYKHERNVPRVIRDIVAPLTIGNITTVAAFLSLVFLSSDAMHDLGLFASLLLAGTILFVLLVLPHLLPRSPRPCPPRHVAPLFGNIFSVAIEKKRWLVWGTLLLTLLFLFLSRETRFETDMQKISYMTDAQQQSFQKMVQSLNQDRQTVYFVSEGESLDEALTAYEASAPQLHQLMEEGRISRINGIGPFLPSVADQQVRLARWHHFWQAHASEMAAFDSLTVAAGFKPGAFLRFTEMTSRTYAPQSADFFAPILQLVADNYVSEQEGQWYVMSLLHAADPMLDPLEQELNSLDPHSFAFDGGMISRKMVESLSVDFNRILWICGLIVFLFLLMTLGRIELSLMAFLPLAVGWCWILGMMHLFDLRFNIVNIILASFIFGQGDDYTIFMTEGLMYEYTYRRKLLTSYKNSIALSAMIMFVGIGSLIIARHPALHSLAEVTIIGMFSVVFMAFLIPPLIFRWLTMHRGEKRLMPITLATLAASLYSFISFLIVSGVITLAGFFLLTIGGKSDKNRLRYHWLLYKTARLVLRVIPRIKTTYENRLGETFEKPAVIISNHQSHLDLMCMMQLTPKLIILTNDWVWSSPFYGQIIRYADYYPVSKGVELVMEQIKKMVAQGYSVVTFPEGTRSPDGTIGRFHRGAFYLAEQLQLDILPVMIHGVGDVLPKREFILRKGSMHIRLFQRITPQDQRFGVTYSERAKKIRQAYKTWYQQLRDELETPAYFADRVIQNYLYKGPMTERVVRREMKRYNNYKAISAQLTGVSSLLVLNAGIGEAALLLAIVHPHMQVVATDEDEEKLDLAANCACVPPNLQYRPQIPVEEYHAFEAILLLHPSEADKALLEREQLMGRVVMLEERL